MVAKALTDGNATDLKQLGSAAIEKFLSKIPSRFTEIWELYNLTPDEGDDIPSGDLSDVLGDLGTFRFEVASNLSSDLDIPLEQLQFLTPFERVVREEAGLKDESETEGDEPDTNPVVEQWWDEEKRGEMLKLINAYGVTLLACERQGASVFSLTSVGEACHKHIYSSYPRQVFAGMDAKWESVLRLALGPGIGVSVPPMLACVLSRATRRNKISQVIREIREEYTDSRKRLWMFLEEMWFAPTLKQQLKLLNRLDKASAHLFDAAFPERCRVLETAWSVTLNAADMKPLSAVGDIGKALLQRNEQVGAVSGFGFTRQLAGDLRKIGGLHSLLPRFLTKAERANFGLL